MLALKVDYNGLRLHPSPPPPPPADRQLRRYLRKEILGFGTGSPIQTGRQLYEVLSALGELRGAGMDRLDR